MDRVSGEKLGIGSCTRNDITLECNASDSHSILTAVHRDEQYFGGSLRRNVTYSVLIRHPDEGRAAGTHGLR